MWMGGRGTVGQMKSAGARKPTRKPTRKLPSPPKVSHHPSHMSDSLAELARAAAAGIQSHGVQDYRERSTGCRAHRCECKDDER